MAIGVGRIPLARETAEQRRARIRRRLHEADTSQEDITANTFAGAPEPETPAPADKSTGTGGGSKRRPTPKVPTSAIQQRVLDRRQSKPTNYKIHVITAMALTLVVRVAALGPKAAFGGK